MKRAAPLAMVLLLAACGYFNAMYNARQRFHEAERAGAAGESSTATRAYLDAIEKAASSYRGHPDGRWADDALLLIARSHYALGNWAPARAAAQEALSRSDDATVRAAAHAFAGAAGARLGDASARSHLDSAAAGGDGEFVSLALLWRARLAFAAGESAAWADLERAAASGSPFAVEARLEAVTRALAQQDTARLRAGFAALLRPRDAARSSDSIARLLDRTSASMGPAFAFSASSPVEHGDWPGEPREALRLRRVPYLALAGDTASAIEEALRIAGRATAETAGPARAIAARYQMSSAADLEDVLAVRATLLPALADPAARALIRTIAALEVLLERAAGGQPLALFAAAELARDELGARAFAHDLFLAYADIVPDAVWAPKAILAAAAIGPASEAEALAGRFHQQRENVYVRALTDAAEPAAFASAEERLATTLAALRRGAFADAEQRDLRVARAAATLDSLKAVALADSLRLACGTLLDSLAITGIRADSVRAACVRTDSALITRFLAIDTLLLRDSTAVLDTLRARNRRGVVRDTTSAHDTGTADGAA